VLVGEAPRWSQHALDARAIFATRPTSRPRTWH
jgi:hypothetical protein